jgi:rhodanese-related sulfurtransferase
MENNASHQTPSTLTDDRRRFFRTCLSDAQVEFGSLKSSLKVTESTLLTAMGALGTACGFNGIRGPDAARARMMGRGMDRVSIERIENDFQQIIDQQVPALEAPLTPFHTDIRILPAALHSSSPLTTARVRLLAGWHMNDGSTGLMGLGGKIDGTPYSDGEIDFLYQLMDHMMMAIRSLAAHSVIHTLKNELDQARQRAAEGAVRSEAVKRELEETLFRLSGFNDLFHELSGLQQSNRVIDSFLLVMLGIFSAQNGAILYEDDTSELSHAAIRGYRDKHPQNSQPAVVKETLEAVFGSWLGKRMEAMQAAIVPTEQLKSLDLLPPHGSIAVSFKVDPGTRGVLCLGKRLIEAQYGTKERELLLALTHTFLAFLKNSSSFETIGRLNSEQKQKNIELEKTVQALSESRRTIVGLEKAGERIKTAIGNAMARTNRLSVIDVALILITGTVLGLVYNFASPSGIPVLPPIWGYPPSPQINIEETRARLAAQSIIVVDARPVEFYKQQHIPGALNLPLALFDFVYMMRFSQIDPQQPMVVYGRNISRHYDEEIAYQLKQRGHSTIYVLTGGLSAWQANGLDISP